MALFVWSEKLEVGFEAIDSQHKELVSLINAFHEAMLAKRSKERLSETLEALLDYTDDHFRREEDLMCRLRYPEYSDHYGQHEALRKKVVLLREQMKSGQATFGMDLMEFLSDWLRQHIVGTDKKLGAFLRAHAPNSEATQRV